MTDDTLTLSKTRNCNGRDVGRLAYSCWRFAGSSQSEAAAKISTALELGMNLIDTAAIYGHRAEFGAAETLLGDVLSANPSLRDEMYLVSKGGIHPPVPYDSRADTLIASCEASLQRLKTDHLDAFLIHRPDLLTPFSEGAEALTRLHKQGKILAAGVSNFSVQQTRALQKFLPIPVAFSQPEISIFETTALFDGALDYCQENNIAPMAWSPLAGGRLFQNPSELTAKETNAIEVLQRIANRNDSPLDAVALAWLLAHPAGIMPIIGTQNTDRMKNAARAFDIKMTRRNWYEVLEASLGSKMP